MFEKPQQATYSEKLKDPRWQKLRLNVLERDKWECLFCENTDRTLAVHHLYYEYGREPWEYPEDALITLCEDCHENERGLRAQSEHELLTVLKKRFFGAYDLLGLVMAFQEMTSSAFKLTGIECDWTVEIKIIKTPKNRQ